jgi:ABC-type amino acid transport substrate-binding protein
MTFLGQGEMKGNSLSTKILMSFFIFTCLILIATYTANLASFLISKDNKLPYNTVDELIYGGYKIAIVNGSTTSSLFVDPKYKDQIKYVSTNFEGYNSVINKEVEGFIS